MDVVSNVIIVLTFISVSNVNVSIFDPFGLPSVTISSYHHLNTKTSIALTERNVYYWQICAYDRVNH